MARARVRASRHNSAADRRRRRRALLATPGGRRLINPSPRLSTPEIAALPDLLGVDAQLGVDELGLAAAIEFAFAGGDSTEALARAMTDCTLPATQFDAACYARDLFVDELVAECMQVEMGGTAVAIDEPFVVRVISNPPADAEVVEFRSAILAELVEDDAIHQQLLRLYQALAELRRLLSQTTGSTRYETTRRRIDIVAAIRNIFQVASQQFMKAKSGLRRIDDFAREVTCTEAHRRMVELLDYENDMARVDVRMQVGVDGRVRSLQIMRLQENDDNEFYSSPLKRILGRVLLWWRGYRFSNDELVDRWLDLVFDGVSHYLPPLLQLHGHIQVYLASLALRQRCLRNGLEVCFAELTDSDGRELLGVFNPLLFAQGVVPTPCDIRTSTHASTTIITGPNSGGKTRLLQALGLAQLLAQGGWYVPARSARLPRASGMFVSLIDEASADQKEGRLGTELIRIRRLFETSRSGAIVILDELCSGTNPSEGEEIFYLVLSLLEELAPEAFITTHFLEFARRLSSDDEPLGLTFLQVELDEHQRATYGFVPGVATTSLAAQTAARLGVTREELIALVRRRR